MSTATTTIPSVLEESLTLYFWCTSRMKPYLGESEGGSFSHSARVQLWQCSPGIHDRVLVVAAVQEDASREHEQTAEEQQQHLQTLLAAVHKVPVEHVRILWRGQSILRQAEGERETPVNTIPMFACVDKGPSGANLFRTNNCSSLLRVIYYSGDYVDRRTCWQIRLPWALTVGSN